MLIKTGQKLKLDFIQECEIGYYKEDKCQYIFTNYQRIFLIIYLFKLDIKKIKNLHKGSTIL